VGFRSLALAFGICVASCNTEFQSCTSKSEPPSGDAADPCPVDGFLLLTGPTMADGRYPSGPHCIRSATLNCGADEPYSVIIKCGDDAQKAECLALFCSPDVGDGGSPVTAGWIKFFGWPPMGCDLAVTCNDGTQQTVNVSWDGCGVKPETATVCNDSTVSDAGTDSASDAGDGDTGDGDGDVPDVTDAESDAPD
jgi:hypothetical protein